MVSTWSAFSVLRRLMGYDSRPAGAARTARRACETEHWSCAIVLLNRKRQYESSGKRTEVGAKRKHERCAKRQIQQVNVRRCFEDEDAEFPDRHHGPIVTDERRQYEPEIRKRGK